MSIYHSSSIYLFILNLPQTSRLEVKILRCSGLAVGNEKRQTSDPYVKAYLLPDKSRGGKKKTKIKKAMLNPVSGGDVFISVGACVC